MVSYQNQDVKFSLSGKRINSRWLKEVAQNEGFELGEIAIVYCSDDYLLGINKRFLNHDYYTDIITFDYTEGKVLNGDLLISIDSVRDNASHFGNGFEQELRRVMVHGILHLIGYDDHSEEQKKTMRQKEDFYLCRRNTM